MIPAWIIAILAFLYAIEYSWRAWKVRERRYIYIGKAFGRILLSIIYFYFSFGTMNVNDRASLVRWSLALFLGIDLFFVIQEHFQRWYMRLRDVS
ncbi:hypothetical protein FBQ81_03310 [Chloroflexi bacterium CFX6]|nr:hypothetical protein [Chloroflexi bacterium CFX6]